MKILIIGSARHGKDTVAEIIAKETGTKMLSSSVAALDIFLFDVLREKYGLKYESKEEAYKDRVNHREKWYNEIVKYNKDDKVRLTKAILKLADIYVGLRSEEEIEKAKEDKIFDTIIGVYNCRLPIEPKESNSIDILKHADFIVTNNGTVDELEAKIKNSLCYLYR